MAISYSGVITQNIRAERARKNLDQEVVVQRMQVLGFGNWHRQTLGKIERGDRQLLVKELFPLAVALGTTVEKLTAAEDDDLTVELPSGLQLPARRTLFNDRSVEWRGTEILCLPPDERQERARSNSEKLARMTMAAREGGADMTFEVGTEEL